jgi:hypothetical protein
MPVHEREEIVRIAHEVFIASSNALIVRYLKAVVLLMFSSLVGIGACLWFAFNVYSSTQEVVKDRWTGTMTFVAERERMLSNPGYVPIDTDEIQKKYMPQ